MPAVIQLLKRLTTKNTYNFIGRGVPTKIGLFLKQRVYILKFTIFVALTVYIPAHDVWFISKPLF